MFLNFSCRLHVYFHGCTMSTDNIGTEFLENSGLLEMADVNNIVLLFPQVRFTILFLPVHCHRAFSNRQQPLPLLYSIDNWPARNSRLTQRESNHYIARCGHRWARDFFWTFHAMLCYFWVKKNFRDVAQFLDFRPTDGCSQFWTKKF